MTPQTKTRIALESIFYVATYFGKGIYEERLTNQTHRILAAIK